VTVACRSLHNRSPIRGSSKRRTRTELAATESAGVLAERERLARELRATIAQGFTSVVTRPESRSWR
jgi:signal transduction histidine kinase